METKTFEKITNEAINKLARAYAKDHSNTPDKDCPDWIIHDYEAGAYAVREILTGFLNLTEEGLKKHLVDLRPISSNREKVIEVLKMVDKYHYCLDSEIELFASDLEGISEISQSCQKEVNSAENVISEVKELNCNNTCKWFKVGYGHCNLCSRNTARLYEHGKDNYEPISEVSEPKLFTD